MGFADGYLNRQAFATPLLADKPADDLKICVVIPALQEESLIQSIQSLIDCPPLDVSAEIIVLINSSIDAPDSVHQFNQQSFLLVEDFANRLNRKEIRIFPILKNDLPAKDAGVGLARKLGMDEALRRFNHIGQPQGIICAFDADATCDVGFLSEILKAYRQDSGIRAAVHYFEHPLIADFTLCRDSDFASNADSGFASNADFALSNDSRAIALYELHLRYLLWAIRVSGYPAAWHTVGSSFSVRAEVYCRQGGMNRRKAGEDFYFLQKVFADGHIGEINSVRILPSARVSDRVPFGTGRAMSQIQQGKKWDTYHFQAFLELQKFFGLIPAWFSSPEGEIHENYLQLHESLKAFLDANELIRKIMEIRSNTHSSKAFIKRFYQWFNQFMMIRYLNESHLKYFQKIDPMDAATALLTFCKINPIPLSLTSMLRRLRNADRNIAPLFEYPLPI